MIKQISDSRWKMAQEAEKEFWKNKYPGELMLIELGEKYSKKAEFIFKECNKIVKINKNTKILQVGGAALDAINYFKIGKRYALDPLADFYKENFEVDYNNIEFKKGIAEKLPYKDNFFDIIILANVLDHIQNPEKALLEIKRVLKEEGLFYLEVDISNRRFIFLYKFWKSLHKVFGKTFNKPHPHIFSSKDVDNLLDNKFCSIKKFEPINGDRKLSLKMLNHFGISGNMFYMGLYSKQKEKRG